MTVATQPPDMDGPRPRSAYLEELRGVVPAHWFKRQPRRLWYAAANLSVMAACFAVISQTANDLVCALLALISGLCFGSLSLQAHDISHGSVLGRGRLRHAVELLLWSLALFPPTMWHVLHNKYHHGNPTLDKDPDRRFTLGERSAATTIYSALFLPSRLNTKLNPIVLFGGVYLVHVTKNLSFALFGRSGRRPRLLTSAPAYTPSERRRIAWETLVGLTLHLLLFWLLDFEVERWLWAVIAPSMLAAAVLINYVFLQHSLAPPADFDDPMLNATSLEVPAALDGFHHHISHHIEHHLFPAMSSNFYPQLRELLRERYGSRYRTTSCVEAWRQLWHLEMYIERRSVVDEG